jgi:Tfp pilus assembly protein PilO
MKEATKQSIAIFVITLLFAATIFVINTLTLKAYNNYQFSRIQTEEKKATLIEIDNYKKLANELTEKYQTIGGDFAKIRMALPSDPEFAGLIGALDAIARMTNVSIADMAFREIEAGSKIDANSPDYSMVEVSLSASGTYEELVNFFAETEKELRLMDVVGISFRRVAQPRNSKQGLVGANVTINAYYQKTK